MPLPSRAQAPEPVAVVLDLVKPFWACRDLGCVGRQAELERLEHALKIGIRSDLAKADKHSPADGRKGEAVPGSLTDGGRSL